MIEMIRPKSADKLDLEMSKESGGGGGGSLRRFPAAVPCGGSLR
jgi:hypothetical protein